jgi:hypothetical protein
MNILRKSALTLMLVSLMGIGLNSFADNNVCKQYIETYITQDSATFDKLIQSTDAKHLSYFKNLVSDCEKTNACSQQNPSSAACASQLATQNFQLSLAWRDKSKKSTTGFFSRAPSAPSAADSFSFSSEKSSPIESVQEQTSSSKAAVSIASDTNNASDAQSSNVNWF